MDILSDLSPTPTTTFHPLQVVPGATLCSLIQQLPAS